jgi:hypothetical protein
VDYLICLTFGSGFYIFCNQGAFEYDFFEKNQIQRTSTFGLLMRFSEIRNFWFQFFNTIFRIKEPPALVSSISLEELVVL